MPSARSHFLIAAAFAARADATADFSLAHVFTDHVVLQRAPAAALLWGTAPPGATVRTTFAGTSYSSTAGADAVWRQRLPPQPASPATNATGATLTFTCSSGAPSLSLNDVLFGDVYLCGGQSNMQHPR